MTLVSVGAGAVGNRTYRMAWELLSGLAIDRDLLSYSLFARLILFGRLILRCPLAFRSLDLLHNEHSSRRTKCVRLKAVKIDSAGYVLSDLVSAIPIGGRVSAKIISRFL